MNIFRYLIPVIALVSAVLVMVAIHVGLALFFDKISRVPDYATAILMLPVCILVMKFMFGILTNLYKKLSIKNNASNNQNK